ncbi:MAG TPA: thioredoxin family protein [Rudaea sp.]|nr:thioredoxin family protein [Rudaea sp.]HSC13301.1 thioredoxin family protein [Rhodanobacteraceae bacterium]
MNFATKYAPIEPSRAEVDRSAGPMLLEFGSPGCSHCRYAETAIERALATHPDVRHLKIEDASGRPLGRSFAVRSWPTLVFLRDGIEVSRLVRPAGVAPIARELERIDEPSAGP